MIDADAPESDATDNGDVAVEDLDEDIVDAVERAAERCETVTVARVVGTVSADMGHNRKLERFVDAARVVLDEDTPITDAQRTTVGDTTTDAVLSEGNA